MFKRCIVVVTLLISTLAAQHSAAREETLRQEALRHEALRQEALRVGFHIRPPFQYYDQNGRLTGLDIELMRLIAKKAGMGVVFQEFPWNRIVTYIRSGELDVGLSAGLRESRLDYAYFSSEYFRLGHNALFVHKDALDRFGAMKDLDEFMASGATLGAQRGASYSSSYEAMLRTQKYNEQMHWVNEDRQNINLLNKGRIDGFLASDFGGWMQVRKLCMHDRIKMLFYLSDDVSARSYLMFSKQSVNTAEVAHISQAMVDLKASGEYQALIDRYRSSKQSAEHCTPVSKPVSTE